MEQHNLLPLLTVNEIEISYRNKIPYQERIPVTHSATAYRILRATWDETKLELLEQFKILLLDRQNHCLAISDIATGGMAACIVDPKVVFVTALKANAAGIILAHNHPSANLQPSPQDLALTRKLFLSGKLLDIAVLDHLIVTDRGYYSFVDEGCMPC
ncbi:DNA repair protein [Larkinella rosea]|uniref:DNA repair protein n=2 Tax=Larkinella rosea TaxID=2025312 RepID=A0A3P1BDH8_9BACT|nr:DNA repair protein [Larkinella rosea]